MNTAMATSDMPRVDKLQLEKERIKNQFANASHSYDNASRLQRLSGQKLINDHADLLNGPVLDLGCGTGVNTALLNGLTDNVTACDLAFEMVEKTRQTTQNQTICVQGDAQNLPFADNRFCVVYSNLMLQWFDDLRLVLGEIGRVLKPHNTLLFTTLLDGTLNELKTAWAGVDDDNHVNTFSPLEGVKQALSDCGFSYEIEVQAVALDYPSVLHLARELKHLGANYVKGRQNKGLMGKQKWQSLAHHYQPFKQPNGAYPATYQVAYIKAIFTG
jgi:malonyl-CoA O-methyltransferase